MTSLATVDEFLTSSTSSPADTALMADRPVVDEADRLRFEAYLGEIFTAYGLDPTSPGTQTTPCRWLQALEEATAGYAGDPNALTTFPTEYRKQSEAAATSQVVEGPISFYALCEHHALPFFGTAHVAYIANDEIIGISKLTRIVRMFARRFTVQERIGEQVADALREYLQPHGVAVRLQAAHLCTQLRGVREEHSRTVTTSWRGRFETDTDARREFLQEVRS